MKNNIPTMLVSSLLSPSSLVDDLEARSSGNLTRHRRPLNALTGFRFFAASYVILFHSRLGAVLNNRGFAHASTFVANGYLAVTLFFMLSGFILAYNYCGQIESRKHVFRFWEARFARIWPAYIFSLLFITVAYLVIPFPGLPDLPVAIATICMVQSWDPFHPLIAGAWNFVCWSLSVEAFFYLMFPLLQTLVERLRWVPLLLFGAAIAAIAILADTPSHGMSTRYPGPWFYITQPIIHLPTFIAGIVIGNIFLQAEILARGFESRTLSKRLTSRVPRTKIPVLTTFGLVSSIFVLCLARGHWEGLTLPSFACFLYGLAVERTWVSRFLSLPLIILAGEISYSMYLLRYPVEIWLLTSPKLHNSPVVDYLYIPLVVIPIAWLSYRFIETPSRRVIRSLFARIQAT